MKEPAANGRCDRLHVRDPLCADNYHQQPSGPPTQSQPFYYMVVGSMIAQLVYKISFCSKES